MMALNKAKNNKEYKPNMGSKFPHRGGNVMQSKIFLNVRHIYQKKWSQHTKLKSGQAQLKHECMAHKNE